METLVKDKKDVKANTANNTVNKTNPVTEENKNPKFVSGNPVNKDSAKPAEAEKPKEAPKAEPAKAAKQPQAEQVKPAAQAEEVKPEKIKTVLNLESTLKLVEELHRRKTFRDKLMLEIDNLDHFEVDLKEDDEETDISRNYFQGCELTIKDSKGRVFNTKNATVIWTTAQMIANLFVNKLAEIEAGIILPA